MVANLKEFVQTSIYKNYESYFAYNLSIKTLIFLLYMLIYFLLLMDINLDNSIR